MITLAITGASGYFARVLLPLLEQDPTVERIIGIDSRPLPQTPGFGKLVFHPRDIRTDDLQELPDGADILLHMAFVLMKRPGARDLDSVNIEGSKRVIDAAIRTGIRKIIFTSSVVAYGLAPDNPVPLTEEHPIRSDQGLYYGRAKARVENYLDQVAAAHPALTITRLRPCTVAGPHADPAQMQSLVGETTPLIHGYDPPYQILDESDLAQALLLAVKDDLPGVYNVTSDGPRTLRELVAMRGGRIMELPLAVVKAFFWIAWITGMTVFAPDWVPLSQYPLVASNEKLKQAGWMPKRTTEQAYLALQPHFGKPATATTSMRGSQ